MMAGIGLNGVGRGPAHRRGRARWQTFEQVALIIAVAAVLASGGSGQPLRAQDRDRAIGRIERSSGPARLERSAAAEPVEPAIAAVPVRRGDRLTTAPGGRLSITFDDGARLVLGEQTSVAILEFMPPAMEMRASLGAGRPGGAMLIELQRGAVRLTAAASVRHGRVELRTEAGTVNVGGQSPAGGWDLVARFGSGELSVLLMAGRIEVRNAAGSAVLDRPRHGFDKVEASREPGRAFGWHRDRIDAALAELAMP